MNLQLSLKRKWFEMTKAGIKTEDYREIKPYWIKRLIRFNNEIDADIFQQLCEELPHPQYYNTLSDYNVSFDSFTKNTLTLGYPSETETDRIIQFEHAGIEIRTGNPDWGAEPNKLYFVIKHGKQIQ